MCSRAHADDTGGIDQIVRAGAETEQIAPSVFVGDPLGKLPYRYGFAGADVDRTLHRAKRGFHDHSTGVADIQIVANLLAAGQFGRLSGHELAAQIGHKADAPTARADVCFWRQSRY